MKSKTSTLERWRFSVTVLLPALLVLVLTGAAVTGFVLWSTADIDDRALERQTVMAAHALENRRRNMSQQQQSVAIWDDAILRASRNFDADWVHTHLGSWMHDYFSHSRVVLLDAADRPVYILADGGPVRPGTFEIGIRPSLDPLLKRLRTAIAAGAIEDYQNGRRATPPAISEFAIVEGRPAMLAAMPILSDSGTLRQQRGSEFILVNVLHMDEALAGDLADQYLFKDAAFVLRPTPGEDRDAYPIVNADGRIIAFFEWTRDRPGRLMLQQTGPVLAGGFAVAAVLIILLMTQLQRSSAAVEAGRRHAEHQASHDGLTGLPNRMGFDSHLAQTLADRAAGGARIDLLLLDLDRFKQVNDTLGHQAGDELICRVSERIRAEVGPETFVARIGGDEFAIVMATWFGGGDPVALSRRIIAALGQPYALRQFQAFVGASIGIVTAQSGEAEPAELVRKADIALYEAKSGGRNRAVVYEEHMNELLQLHHTIEAELREALAADDQLSVAFQPLVDQASRRVVGAEALARWFHPKFGQISPARFIPIAENSGLIETLGEFVLRRACELGAMVPGRTVAVNISPTQLRNPAFATQVFDILNATGMRADDLELEITESILLDDEHVSAHNLLTFRAAGVHIALDDFGTGYSSLSYLKRYPVDRIKIDRSFVSQLAPDHVSVDITRALVTLAHAMNIHVTAEGVETEQQAKILGELGCNTLQGFLFSGAVGVEAIKAIFAQPENLPQRRRRTASVA